LIKDEKLTKHKFEWQSGYGAFSHGYREKQSIIEYIKEQEEHHKKRSFQEEYLALLEKFEINFKEEYIFEFIEE